jgi:hypothetical protein
LDLYEEKDQIVVKAEMPGLTKDDIQISIADNVLTIKGEKRERKRTPEKITTAQSEFTARSPASCLCRRRLIRTRFRRPLKMGSWRFACQRAKKPRKKRSR